MDVQTVMTWLEICGTNRDCSGNCPYGDGSGEYEDGRCRENLMADALSLLKDYNVLKKQHERAGKWIEEEPNSYTKKTYCSVCKESAPFIAIDGDYYGRNMHGKREKTKYCPNCGACMTQTHDSINTKLNDNI